MSKKTYASKSEGKAKKIISIVCLILAAVFVIGVVAWSEIYNSGLVQRHTAAVKTENFTVTSTMMNYYATMHYQELTTGEYASMLSYYYNYDTSKSLSQQATEPQPGVSWEQFFKESAKTEVADMLVRCEAAKAAGKSLSDEDYAQIDAAIKNLDTYATTYGYSTTDAFLKANYGANTKDIRKCMEYSLLADNYGEELYNSYSYEDKDFDNYYSENKTSFLMVDYLTYTIKADDKKVDDLKDDAKEEDKKDEDKKDETTEAETDKKEEATVDPDSDDKKEETKKDYSHLKAFADKMKDAKTKEEYEKAVRAYLTDYLYKGMSKEALEKDKIDLDQIIADCKVEGFKKPSSETELSKWLFADGTKPYATRNEYDETKGTFTVYMILPAQYDEKLDDCQYREDYKTAEYYYIFLSSKDEGSMGKAKTTADAILKEYNEDATEEHFKKLESTDGYGKGYGKVEGGVKNALGDSVDAWLFASDRKAGDVSTIEGEEGYYVIYFAGNNETKWKIDAENALRSGDYEEAIHTFTDTYTVSYMSKGMNFVKIASN